MKFNNVPSIVFIIDVLAHVVSRMQRLTVRNEIVLMEFIIKAKDALSYQKLTTLKETRNSFKKCSLNL